MPLEQLASSDSTTAPAHSNSPDLPLPRLGGRRPLYADVTVWGSTIACLAVASVDPSLASPVSEVCASLFLAVWALWRSGRFSEHLADPAFRREIALTGVSPARFLRHQLRSDSIAAFGPIILRALFMSHARWIYAASAFTTIAGACWVFSGRCNRGTTLDIAARTGITVVAASFGISYAGYGLPRLLNQGHLGESQLLMAIVAICLFLTAAQVRITKSLRTGHDTAVISKDPAKIGSPLRLLCFLAVAMAGAITACLLCLATGTWGPGGEWVGVFTRWQMDQLYVLVTDLTGAGFRLAVCLAVLACFGLRSFLSPLRSNAFWPGLILGALAIAIGVVAISQPSASFAHRWRSFRPQSCEELRGLVIVLPAAGMALFAARHPVSSSARKRVLLMLGMLVASFAGALLGVMVRTVNSDRMILMQMAFCGLGIAAFAAARRHNQPGLTVGPLLVAIALSEARDSGVTLTLTLASAAAAVALWSRVKRSYFSEL